MTDPERKPDPLNPEGDPTPVRPASDVPDWTRSMTGSSVSPEPVPSVAADAFAGSTPQPSAPQPPANDTIIVTPGTPDPSVRHQYAAPPPPTMGTPSVQAAPDAVTDNKKIVAGILGIVLGGLGVHKFYLGINQSGFILLGVFAFGLIFSWLIFPVVFCWAASIVGLVEGIIYLTKTDAQFKQEYEIGKKPWF